MQCIIFSLSLFVLLLHSQLNALSIPNTENKLAEVGRGLFDMLSTGNDSSMTSIMSEMTNISGDVFHKGVNVVENMALDAADEVVDEVKETVGIKKKGDCDSDKKESKSTILDVIIGAITIIYDLVMGNMVGAIPAIIKEAFTLFSFAQTIRTTEPNVPSLANLTSS